MASGRRVATGFLVSGAQILGGWLKHIFGFNVISPEPCATGDHKQDRDDSQDWQQTGAELSDGEQCYYGGKRSSTLR